MKLEKQYRIDTVQDLTMNAQISMTTDLNTDTPADTTPEPTKWRPVGWIDGFDDPNSPELGHTPENTEEMYAGYKSRGYYTAGGKLVKRKAKKGEAPVGEDAHDAETARAVSHNRRLLRDSWNTHAAIWRLAEHLIGRKFTVDPFWNEQTTSLTDLARTLNGKSPSVDGLLTVEKARERLARQSEVDLPAPLRLPEHDIAELTAYLAALGEDIDEHFPACWRGLLLKGEAAAAVNGPHSITEKWLTQTWHYSLQEFTAAFVPDSGDGWFQEIGMRFALVVRLGRVNCSPPPGISRSTPRGPSALLIGIPPSVQQAVRELSADLARYKRGRAEITAKLDELLPEPTRRVLVEGASYRVPLWSRPKAGMQYAYVQAGAANIAGTLDFGLLTK